MSTHILTIDGLSRSTQRGELFRLLIEVGQLDKSDIGKIDLLGSIASVEINTTRLNKLISRLNAHQLNGRLLTVYAQTDMNELPTHFAQQLQWLRQEAAAEEKQFQQEAAEQDSRLNHLRIQQEEVGLGGRIVIRLASRTDRQPLPYTNLSTGTPVFLLEEATDPPQTWRGVVTYLSRHHIELMLNQSPEPQSERPLFSITRANDQIGRQRMEQAVYQVSAARDNRLAHLRQVMLGERPPDPPLPAQPLPEDLLTPLNPPQQEALTHALHSADVSLIHGPPGTGKTTTVIALIRAAIRRGERVLACAPSNQAVDNIATGLLATAEPFIRLGHPARILPEIEPFTLDVMVAQHPDARLAHKLRKEARALFADADKWRRAKPAAGEKAAQRNEARSLFDEADALEARALEAVLDQSPIVLSTLTGLDSQLLGKRPFTLCVIDEAGQATEPATWIPITRAERVVLAGDHQQLPPTILSRTAAAAGFGVSLLERLMTLHQGALARQLTVQYRMHEQIMAFSSQEFYAGSLIADESVATHLLADLPHVEQGTLTETAVLYIDTAGASYDEEKEPDGSSRLNPQEGGLLIQKANALLAAGVRPDEIGIITPYAAQATWLRERVDEGIEVFSVDGFQGREKEAILISLVRANDMGEVGFLAETRRMNVALTRARRLLLVIGDSATITSEEFYGRFITYTESISAYRSVWEELEW